MELLEWAGYSVDENIGCGRFGCVYMVMKDKCLYAAKIIQDHNKKRWLPLQNLNSEVEILRKIHKLPNVAHLIETLPSMEFPRVLIMEFIPGMTLDFYSPVMGAPGFDELMLQSIAQQLLTTVASLHQYGIAHRDIKLDNIIFNDGRITLVDFGTATVRGTTKLTGSLLYMSPEILNNNDDSDGGKFYTLDALKRSDMYAIGITLYMLANKVPPFPIHDVTCSANFRPELDKYRPSDMLTEMTDILICNKFNALLI